MGDQTQTNPTQTTPPETLPGKNEGQGEAGSKPTFTQEQLDKIVGERAVQAKKSALSDFLKELGLENPDDLKKIITERQQQEQASKTELQKAQDQAKTADDKYKALQQQLDAEKAARMADKRNAAVVTAAQKARANAPDDVVLWASAHLPDELAKTIDADGNIDEKAVNALIELVRKERKEWFGGTGPGSPSNAGGRTPEPSADAKKKAAQAQFQAVRKNFR